MIKKVWDHIHANNLQDPTNKRNINCDDTLKALLGKDSISMFELSGLLKPHIHPLTELSTIDYKDFVETWKWEPEADASAAPAAGAGEEAEEGAEEGDGEEAEGEGEGEAEGDAGEEGPEGEDGEDD